MLRQRGWTIVGGTAAVSAWLASLHGVTARAGAKISAEFDSSALGLARASCAREPDADGACAIGGDGLPVAPSPAPESLLYPVELGDGSVLLVHQFLDRPELKDRVSGAGPRNALNFRCDATLVRRLGNTRVRTQHSESFVVVRAAWLASLGACEIR